jgi:hypothetical protein
MLEIADVFQNADEDLQNPPPIDLPKAVSFCAAERYVIARHPLPTRHVSRCLEIVGIILPTVNDMASGQPQHAW